MENPFSDEDDYIKEGDNDYMGEVVHGPFLEKSPLNKQEEEISFTVRSLNALLIKPGKAQLITESGTTYTVTVIGLGYLQPHPDTWRSGEVQAGDQVVIIGRTDVSFEQAQQARKFFQGADMRV